MIVTRAASSSAAVFQRVVDAIINRLPVQLNRRVCLIQTEDAALAEPDGSELDAW